MVTPDAQRVLMVVIDFRAEESEVLALAVAALENYCSGKTIETGILRNEI